MSEDSCIKLFQCPGIGSKSYECAEYYKLTSYLKTLGINHVHGENISRIKPSTIGIYFDILSVFSSTSRITPHAAMALENSLFRKIPPRSTLILSGTQINREIRSSVHLVLHRNESRSTSIIHNIGIHLQPCQLATAMFPKSPQALLQKHPQRAHSPSSAQSAASLPSRSRDTPKSQKPPAQIISEQFCTHDNQNPSTIPTGRTPVTSRPDVRMVLHISRHGANCCAAACSADIGTYVCAPPPGMGRGMGARARTAPRANR